MLSTLHTLVTRGNGQDLAEGALVVALRGLGSDTVAKTMVNYISNPFTNVDSTLVKNRYVSLNCLQLVSSCTFARPSTTNIYHFSVFVFCWPFSESQIPAYYRTADKVYTTSSDIHRSQGRRGHMAHQKSTSVRMIATLLNLVHSEDGQNPARTLCLWLSLFSTGLPQQQSSNSTWQTRLRKSVHSWSTPEQCTW